MQKIFKIRQSVDKSTSTVERKFWKALMQMEAEELWVVITDEMPGGAKRGEYEKDIQVSAGDNGSTGN